MGLGCARLGDVCSGHPGGNYYSRPNDQGSPDVFCNGLPKHRQSDHWQYHGVGNDSPPHDSYLAAGSPTVYTNGLQQGRIGDPVQCGSKVLTGSPDVFVGDTPFSPPVAAFSRGRFDTPRALRPSETSGLAFNSANRQQYISFDTIENNFGTNPEIGPSDVPIDEVKWDECSTEELNGDLNSKVYQTAKQRLAEANSGAWRETGTNQNIINLRRDIGITLPGNAEFRDDTHWCAAFVGSVLKRSCASYKKTLRAGDYTSYGAPLDKNDPSSWKPGDVIVFKRTGGSGHVAIIDRVENGKIYYIGGNQSNNVTLASRNYDPNQILGVSRPT